MRHSTFHLEESEKPLYIFIPNAKRHAGPQSRLPNCNTYVSSEADHKTFWLVGIVLSFRTDKDRCTFWPSRSAGSTA